ncbi:MAG: glycoside hydrolase family 2 TIM barrel-domain containing protein [Rhodopirellula sp. JB044]|uniref:glycoside hydrolase family 2 TIM barrel-domain containing protein n=1 Tax=Rhodopirellula sp. JB044 TaxID=3342844 RepID=UPI00370B3DA7
MNYAKRLPIFCVGMLCVSFLTVESSRAAEVTVKRDDQGHFTLLRDGELYFIRGAGGSEHLSELVACGGNSIRTWGIETLEKRIDNKPLLDYCEELGISVSVGIWIQHERHGFDYSDPKQVADQREKVREAVRRYKDHPAILMWGLGNEMEGPESESGAVRIWKELDHLAKIVKSEDPNHPVMTVIAGASALKIKGIMDHYPNIDVLGVNSYGAAASVAGDVKAAGWKKPFALTEFGPSGHWEVPQTSWGAAIEPSSRAKAASYFVTQSILTEDAGDICVGSYCFLWGQKQEKTSTWYGMFLPSGERLPQVDAMCRAWTGEWPENRCPKVSQIDSDLTEATFGPGELVTSRVHATDPDDDPMTYTWYVQAETTERSVGGDRESVPPLFPNCLVRARDGEAVIRTPDQPGNYRLFVIVRDGQGNASADNVCFRVANN